MPAECRRSVCALCYAGLRSRLSYTNSELQACRRRVPSTRRFNHDHHTALYDHIAEPTAQQLAAASYFFKVHNPKKVWTARGWRDQSQDNAGILTPEVLFLGRSNCGKSSLINALTNSAVNYVSPAPGKTKVLHAWGLFATDGDTGHGLKGWAAETRLTVLDAPGYGHGSAPEWGEEIIKYVLRRKQLRRVYLLIDSRRLIKEIDMRLLNLFRWHATPFQLILTKMDLLNSPFERRSALELCFGDLRQAAESQNVPLEMSAFGGILGVGLLGDGQRNTHVDPDRYEGVSHVQWSMLQAVGLEEFAMQTASTKSESSPSYSQDSSITADAEDPVRQQGSTPRTSAGADGNGDLSGPVN